MMSSLQVVQVVCGALLSLIVLALVFHPSFRRDLITGDAKAKFIGILTVQGALVIGLCALFLGGLIYTLHLDHSSSAINKLHEEIQRLHQEAARRDEELSGTKTQLLGVQDECETVAREYLKLRMKKPENFYRVGRLAQATEHYRELASSLPSCLTVDARLLAAADDAFKLQEQRTPPDWSVVCLKYRRLLTPLMF